MAWYYYYKLTRLFPIGSVVNTTSSFSKNQRVCLFKECVPFNVYLSLLGPLRTNSCKMNEESVKRFARHTEDTWCKAETSLGTSAVVRHLSFSRAITLLSVRGRGARRFFDSVPGVSQPGDGLRVACLRRAWSSTFAEFRVKKRASRV